MKKTNILFILWGILVFGIVTCLTILGFLLEKVNNNYKNLEEKIKESGIKYSLEKDLYPDEIDEIRITKQELIESGLLDELKINDDICEGYVIIKLLEGYEYKAYIRCKKYMTEGYVSE